MWHMLNVKQTDTTVIVNTFSSGELEIYNIFSINGVCHHIVQHSVSHAKMIHYLQGPASLVKLPIKEGIPSYPVFIKEQYLESFITPTSHFRGCIGTSRDKLCHV